MFGSGVDEREARFRSSQEILRVLSDITDGKFEYDFASSIWNNMPPRRMQMVEDLVRVGVLRDMR